MSIALVGGALANKPLNGGAAWTRLNWILGLRRLGFDVVFAEQIDPETCVDEAGRPTTFENSVNRRFFTDVTRSFGLERATLLCGDREHGYGLSRTDLLDVAGAADLLLNISGHLTLPGLMRRVGCRVFVDLDPGYTQYWHASGMAGARLEEYNHHVTVGLNVGAEGNVIPTAGIRWRHTLQPVVLDEWPVSATRDRDGFSTVASWRGPYGPIPVGDATLGPKAHQFRRFVELPERVTQPFEIALDIDPADAEDLSSLRSHGWRVVDPRAVAGDPAAFRRYVQASSSEFSVAQGVYVDTDSGWFADRTVRYLASGKPALVQDTGFGRHLPTGEGLVTFRTLAEAVAGAESIERDYDAHSAAARALAERMMDSDVVLGRLVDEIGVAP